MENLNAETVKEWLEIWAEDTPYPDQGQALLDALAFINSQEQRIKELAEENEKLLTALANYDRLTDVRIAEEYYTAEAYEEIREENERLREKADRNLDNLKAVLEERNENTLVSDTVREFAQRLKARNAVYCINKNDLKEMNFVVDQIAKEMLEGEK